MVSETTRNEIWQQFLDVARLLRYYTSLSNRHRRKQQLIRILLMAAATSGIVTLLDLLPAFMQELAAAAVAILVVWDSLGDYARKAAVLHAICIECNRLESRWHKLWFEIDRPDLDDADALHQCDELGQRLLDITSQAGPAGVEIDAELKSLLQKSDGSRDPPNRQSDALEMTEIWPPDGAIAHSGAESHVQSDP